MGHPVILLLHEGFEATHRCRDLALNLGADGFVLFVCNGFHFSRGDSAGIPGVRQMFVERILLELAFRLRKAC